MSCREVRLLSHILDHKMEVDRKPLLRIFPHEFLTELSFLVEVFMPPALQLRMQLE